MKTFKNKNFLLKRPVTFLQKNKTTTAMQHDFVLTTTCGVRRANLPLARHCEPGPRWQGTAPGTQLLWGYGAGSTGTQPQILCV